MSRGNKAVRLTPQEQQLITAIREAKIPINNVGLGVRKLYERMIETSEACVPEYASELRKQLSKFNESVKEG